MMSLKSFGAELRRVREEQRISIMDISAATRINMKFLEAMEEGNFAILPQTYVRAFLREYAQCVSLSVDEVLAKYDEASGSKPADKKGDVHAGEKTSTPVPGLQRQSARAPLQRHAMMIAAALGAIVLALYMINTSTNSHATRPVPEVPFDNVVRESEATLVKPETIVSSTPVPMKPPEPDSLRLEIATNDSVWISIVIDGRKTEEYLFPPNRRKTWAAKDRYMITMGNAGGATFKLNGEEIPPLGRRGAVVRNVVVNEELLSKKL